MQEKGPMYPFPYMLAFPLIVHRPAVKVLLPVEPLRALFSIGPYLAGPFLHVHVNRFRSTIGDRHTTWTGGACRPV
jgi:hypothetical protein